MKESLGTSQSAVLHGICFHLQETYKKTVEERVVALKAQHSDKLQSLTRQLELLRIDQAQQLKELSQFRAEFSKNSSKQIEESKSRHRNEMHDLRETLIHGFAQERSLLEEKHREEVTCLKAELEEEMRDRQIASSKVSDEMVVAERRVWEEREGTLRRECSQKEEQLNHQLSMLSNDLRLARDNLALSEKKVADLLSQFEDNEAGSADIRGRLGESEGRVESLQNALRETKVELEISREHYQQQSAEMKGMAGKNHCTLVASRVHFTHNSVLVQVT